ncbi:MAG: hypothetical protein LBD94_03105 [Rickettsiales bacterium]|jgi:hypothetical protein|nr:hypothetical protein [Rickettsiales bacterium]
MNKECAQVIAPTFTERELNSELKKVRAVPKGQRGDKWLTYKNFLVTMMRIVKKNDKQRGK